MLQRAEFCTPFFNYKERGFKVEFLGEEKLDDIDVLKLKLTRDNNEVETWYLDSKTFLEYMSVSAWEDFGRPALQEAYYSDFRTVANIKIPFYIERSYSIRHHVYEIEKVEVNIVTDNSVFKMPLSEEMKKMQVLEGDWDVIVEAMGRAGSWVTVDTTTSCIKFMKNTNLLQEELSYDRFFPMMIKINWTYNTTSKKYMMTAFNSFYSTTGVYEGTVTNDTILFDNTEISFSTTDIEKKRSGRYLVTGIGENGFVIEVSVSTDKGEKWTSRERFTYKRRMK